MENTAAQTNIIPKDLHISLRLSKKNSGLKAEIKKIADVKKRSVNELIERLLEDFIENPRELYS